MRDRLFCGGRFLLIAVTLIGGATVARAEDPKPAAAAPATAPAADGPRTARQVLDELASAKSQLADVIKSGDAFTDPAKRAEIAPAALPGLKKMLALADELAGTEMMGMAPQLQSQMLTMLDVFGDSDAHARLEAGAAKGDLSAKGSLLLARWMKSSTDAEAQAKILVEATELAKANPASEPLMESFMAMSEIGAASPELREHAVAVIVENMKGPQVAQIKEMAEGQRKLRSLENKPLNIQGVRSDGAAFSTADWKGKVILVDFWATWCGPCIGELPRVKKAYADFHGKGLEVLGVSCDEKASALKDFLAKNPDMPWPQLFDASKPGWHALATEFGINGIPTMFLIDRKGVVRSVSARENFEELIPKLLAEQ